MRTIETALPVVPVFHRRGHCPVNECGQVSCRVYSDLKGRLHVFPHKNSMGEFCEGSGEIASVTYNTQRP